MTVDGSLVSIINRVVIIDFDSLLAMRNKKCEGLSIKFVLLEYFKE